IFNVVFSSAEPVSPSSAFIGSESGLCLPALLVALFDGGLLRLFFVETIVGTPSFSLSGSLGAIGFNGPRARGGAYRLRPFGSLFAGAAAVLSASPGRPFLVSTVEPFQSAFFQPYANLSRITFVLNPIRLLLLPIIWMVQQVADRG